MFNSDNVSWYPYALFNNESNKHLQNIDIRQRKFITLWIP